MLTRIVQFIVLAPFIVLGKFLDIIFHPPKPIMYVEDENQNLKNQNKRMKRALQLQVSNHSALESSLIQMDREHQRELKQLKEYYEGIIRKLQQELKANRRQRMSQP